MGTSVKLVEDTSPMIGPTVHLCIDCHQPLNALNVVICNTCITALENDLVRVDEVVADLQVTKGRQDVAGEQCGGSGTKLHAPAPINLSALECETKLHTALMGWALRLVTGHVEDWHDECTTIRAQWQGTDRQIAPVYPVKPSLPGRSAHMLTNYLMGQLPHLRTQVWAAGLRHTLARHLRQCVAVSERAQPRIFAGVCPETLEGVECGTYTYEPQGTIEARCKTCGTTWDIPEWTGRALISKEYVIGYPPALSRMLSTGGVKVSEQDIRNWAARGVIERANPERDKDDRELRAMYRLGDVLDAWQDTTNRKQDAA